MENKCEIDPMKELNEDMDRVMQALNDEIQGDGYEAYIVIRNKEGDNGKDS
jgi:hypothetical protein